MNSDSDVRLLKPDECRRRVNLRSEATEGNNAGASENIKGTLKINNPYYDVNDIVVDSCPYEEEGSIIFFVYNPDPTKHKILQYKPAEYDYNDTSQPPTPVQGIDDVLLILQHKYLNFQPNRSIDANIIGGLLYWTDGYFNTFLNNDFNPPRKINIEKAKKFTTSYLGNQRQDIELIADALVFHNNPSYQNSASQHYTTYISRKANVFSVGDKVVPWINEGDAYGYRYKPSTGYGVVIAIGTYGLNSYTVVDRIWTDTSYGILVKTGHILPYEPDMYYGIDWQVMDAIKHPPMTKPGVSYDDDGSNTSNKLKKFLYQFVYRWIYDDNEPSVFSPMSYIALPTYDQTIYGGTGYNYYTKDNVIHVWIDTGSMEVKTIEIGVRSQNTGDIVIINEKHKYDINGNVLLVNDIYSIYMFYNNEIVKSVNKDEAARTQDSVPIVAYRQDIIEKNRLTYARYYDGFDIPNIDIIITSKIKQVVFNINATMVHTCRQLNYWVVGYGSRNYATTFVDLYTVFPSTGTAPDYAGKQWDYTIRAIRKIDNYQFLYASVSYVSTALDTMQTIVNQLALALSQSSVRGITKTYYPASPEITPTNNSTMLNSELAVLVSYTPSISSITCTELNSSVDISTSLMFDSKNAYSKKYTDFKSGAYHPIAIEYFDRGNRGCGALISDNMIVYAKHPTEYVNQPLPVRNYFQYEIKHVPPIYATHYRLLYAKNTTSYNPLQIYTSGHRQSSSLIWIYPNYTLSLTGELMPITKLTSYTFTPGDRIVFLYAVKISTGIIETNYLSGGVYESFVIKEDTSAPNLQIIIEATDSISGLDFTLYSYVIEITKDKTATDSENLEYYETGEEFKILNPHTSSRSHQGPLLTETEDVAWQRNQIVQNGVSVLSARGNIWNGDMYLRLRTSAHGVSTSPSLITYPVQDPSCSDYYTSNSVNIGHPSTVIPGMKFYEYISYLCHSQLFIENSNTNGLSTFYGSDFNVLPEKYGPIYKAIENGDILRVIQRSKCTSIFIGKSGMKQATLGSGQIVAVVDSVIGGMMQHPESYGTVFPGSVVNSVNFTYFFDIYNSCYCRWATNGVNQIVKKDSATGYDFGMGKYFRDKSRALLASGIENVSVYATFETEFENLIITFVDRVNPANNETIMFHEPSNTWSTFLSFIPEAYGTVGLIMTGSLNGVLYRHNVNPIRNKFYNTQYDSEVEIVGNMNPNDNKVFDALEISSLQFWEAPDTGDIYVITDGQPMQSRLKSARFKTREGKKIASFGRDMYTHGVEKLNDLVNGRPLRGQAIKIRLVNHDTTESVLFAVNINATISE